MKIGILTFHRAQNYGAVLQCYALQTFLSEKGHNVFILDYNKSELWNYYKWFLPQRFYFQRNIRTLVRRYCKELLLLPIRKKRYDGFIHFNKKYLNTISLSEINDNPFDIIIVGSDQVWDIDITHGFDSMYWGNFKKPTNTKLISYAASLETYWKPEDDKNVLRYLRNFDVIGVREDRIKNKLNSINSSLLISVVPDPTLILNESNWTQLVKKSKIKEPYILVYQARNSDLLVKKAIQFSQKIKIKLLFLSAGIEKINSKECICSSPEDFLTLFKNATYIISSSFHGVVFSLIFNKPFTAIKLNDGKDGRIINLLRKIKRENYLCDIDSDIEYHNSCGNISDLNYDPVSIADNFFNKIL